MINRLLLVVSLVAVNLSPADSLALLDTCRAIHNQCMSKATDDFVDCSTGCHEGEHCEANHDCIAECGAFVLRDRAQCDLAFAACINGAESERNEIPLFFPQRLSKYPH